MAKTVYIRTERHSVRQYLALSFFEECLGIFKARILEASWSADPRPVHSYIHCAASNDVFVYLQANLRR